MTSFDSMFTASMLMASTAGAVAFYAFSALAIAAAVLMVVQRSPVASVLWLVVSFVGMAGLFVLMQAYFLAVIQILVYAGAILVLFLFVIMLLDLRSPDTHESLLPRIPAVGLIAAALFLVSMTAVVAAAKPYFGEPMAALVARNAAAAEAAGLVDSVKAVGVPLFERFLLPFEVTSMLLLAAIVGAVAITKKKV